MISGSPQNFDLLGLSGIEPITGGLQVPPVIQNTNAQAFGNILNLLLGDVPASNAAFTAPVSNAKSTSFDQQDIFANQLAADIQNAALTLTALSANCSQMNGQVEEIPEAVNSPAVTLTSESPAEMLPNISAPHVKALMQQMSMPPTDGTYSVLSAKTNNENVEFTVRPEAEPNKTMVLTLPASALKDVTSLLSIPGTPTLLSSREQNAGYPVRVSLGESTETSRMVATVLSKLNVRELTIDASPVTATQAAKPEVAVTLVGEFQATPVQLKLQVEPKQLRMKNTAVTALDAQDEQALLTKDSCLPNQAVPAVAAESSTDGKLDWSSQLTREFDLPKKVSVNQVKVETGTLSMQAAGETGTRTTTTPGTTVPVHQVKFTLPDLSAKTMVESGRSVTIKIEPDYLGPAKLHLSVTNDALTARVTVDTPQAKAAVEGSLDKLTDQLNRVGVTVNRIEVSLSNNGAGHQFADQQANWNRPHRMPFLGAAEQFSLSGEPVATTQISTVQQYLHTRSVNLYA